MILLGSVIIGLIAGIIRAIVTNRSYQPHNLKSIWLVFIALFAQWIVFSFEPTRTRIPDLYASLVLILSQTLLLYFAWENRKIPGFWLLGLGLVLNLGVILLNGGWMPISPDTVRWLAPEASDNAWEIGARLGFGKDKVLLIENTRFWILSDQFRTPGWYPSHVAFSVGDVIIAIGAFWLLWTLGGKKSYQS